MSKSQNQMIGEYLKAGHSITPLEALEKFGCFRLGARIADLKKQGLDIETEIVNDKRTGKHWAKYKLLCESQVNNLTVYDCYQPAKARELAEKGELF
jgi:hypothetical protein